METYSLATAIAAATIAQLKQASTPMGGEPITGDFLEAECQRARSLFKYGLQPNLMTLRTSFFLHVYHENQQAGGGTSLLYLREAITIAQMMGLHREASYIGLSPKEQQLRRRILWLLFVTERFVVSSTFILRVSDHFQGGCHSTQASRDHQNQRLLPGYRQ